MLCGPLIAAARMPAAALPPDEHSRLAMLEALGILDTPPEDDYDDIVAIAAASCGVPTATISLIDTHRQWFKARVGMAEPQTPRDRSFCAHAILSPGDLLVVGDAREDARFADNPLVLGGDIRFYAGAPLVACGMPVGAVCVIDSAPRTLAAPQLDALRALSRQAARLIELRRLGRMLDVQRREREWYEAQLIRHHAAGAALDVDAATRFDAVTGLPGTRAFLEILEAELQAGAAPARPLQLALVEMDARDAIEDLHGAAERDRLLQGLAHLLRAGDLHGRLARVGDAFAVMLAMPPAQAFAQCELVRALASGDCAAFPLTLSIGLAEARATDSAASLFQRAADALSRARARGDAVVAGTAADQAGKTARA